MLLLLLACTPIDTAVDSADTDTDTDTDTETDTDTDTDADTDTDTDTDTDPLPSFAFDGGVYTLADDTTTCNADLGPWTVSGTAQRDGVDAAATANLYFAAAPAPGEYTVTAFQAGLLPPEGEAWIGVIDFRDKAGVFSGSDGSSGSVTVSGSNEVTWTSASLTGADGALVTDWGWMRCP